MNTKKLSTKTITTAIAILIISSMTSIISAQPQRERLFNGNGTESNPYQIATSADLARLSSLINDTNTNAAFAEKYYLLTADIDLSGYDNWMPIGAGLVFDDTLKHRLTFRGVFDGAGNTIVNLNITHAERVVNAFQGFGLFGVVDGGAVKNLSVKNVNVAVNVGRTGGIVGAAIANGEIVNCNVIGNVGGANSLGGIAGHVDENSVIDDCNFSGNISGVDMIGGIAGHVYSSVVTNCNFAGDVNVNSIMSNEIVGHVWNSVITNNEIIIAQINDDENFADVSERSLTRVVAVENNPSIVITVAPNPAERQSRMIDFIIADEQGEHAGSPLRGTLTIYDRNGNIVNRTTVNNNITAWDLRDARGRVVNVGTYLVRGTIITQDGNRESVSAVFGVR